MVKMRSAAGKLPPVEQAAPVEVSDITFEEIYGLFHAGGTLTDLQKDANWGRYEGKCVKWEGELAHLDESLFGFGDISIGFKHRPETFTYDVLVSAPASMKSTLLTMEQGARYAYRARLDNYPGAIMPLTADWGCE